MGKQQPQVGSTASEQQLQRGGEDEQRYAVLAQFGRAINELLSRRDSDELLRLDTLTTRLHELLAPQLPQSTLFFLAVYQPKNKTLEPYFPEGMPGRGALDGFADWCCRTALAQKRPLLTAALGAIPSAPLLILPMAAGSVALGTLGVELSGELDHDRIDLELFELLANHVTLALGAVRQNSRLLEQEVKQQLMELQILQRIDRELNRTIELEAVLQKILEWATDRVPAYKASIYLHNPRSNTLDTAAFLSIDEDYHQETSLALDDERGLVRYAFASQQALRVGDVRNDPIWASRYIQPSDKLDKIRSELDVPLVDEDSVIGVINFASETPDAFSEKDETFLVTLAGQAVLAIKKAQAYEREKRSAAEGQALIDVGKEIVSQLDLDNVFRLILDKALQITSAQAGTLMLYDPRNNDLWMAAGRGVRPEYKINGRHPLTQGVVGKVASEKRRLNVPDVLVPPWDKIHLSFIPDIRSELAVPLLQGETLRGVINVESTEVAHFESGDERLLTALADLALIALRNAETYQQAQKRQQRLRALYDVGREMIYFADGLERIVQLILRIALDLSGAEVGDLHLYQGDMVTQTFLASRPDPSAEPTFGTIVDSELTTPSFERGIVTHVAQQRTAHYADDTRQDPYYRGDPAYLSEAAVPLVDDEQNLIGVLNLESRRAYAFDQDQRDMLGLLASQAVIAIQNSRLYTRLQLLYQLSSNLAKVVDHLEIGEAYNLVRDSVARLQVHSQVTVRRYEAEMGRLRLVSSIETHAIRPPAFLSADSGLHGEVRRKGDTVDVRDLERLPEGIGGPELPEGVRSWIGTPIQFRDSYYGNLALSSTETNRVHLIDRQLFRGIADQLALTIHRLEAAQARQQAEQRVREAEAMTSIGQATFGLAHRLANDLGLVKHTVRDINKALDQLNITDDAVSRKLDLIVEDVHRVITLSKELKQKLGAIEDERGIERVVEELSVEALLAEARTAYPQLPASIVVNVGPCEALATALAVRGEVADILHNLVVNAVEAMIGANKAGMITLSARTVAGEIEIEVKDTGPGMPNETAARVFELFFSTKGSSGFGLWSARRYALQNRGDLRVASTPGQGTTFTLTLPQAHT
jgi:GAF domain-containing protein/anti-sigma regulatory factor (Ser/Thr protein kinase)